MYSEVRVSLFLYSVDFLPIFGRVGRIIRSRVLIFHPETRSFAYRCTTGDFFDIHRLRSLYISQISRLLTLFRDLILLSIRVLKRTWHLPYLTVSRRFGGSAQSRHARSVSRARSSIPTKPIVVMTITLVVHQFPQHKLGSIPSRVVTWLSRFLLILILRTELFSE